MDTPTFIQFGEESDGIFNTAQLTAIVKKSFPVSETRKATYKHPEWVEDGVVHSIYVFPAGWPSPVEYYFVSQEARDAHFEVIRAIMQPTTVMGSR